MDVSVVHEADRWVAVATLGDQPEVELGNSREEAIREALCTLGREAAESLLETLPKATT